MGFAVNHPICLPAQNYIFPLLLFGLGILVSLWPFHTWAPVWMYNAISPANVSSAPALRYSVILYAA